MATGPSSPTLTVRFRRSARSGAGRVGKGAGRRSSERARPECAARGVAVRGSRASSTASHLAQYITLTLATIARSQREEHAMTTMMHWSPFTSRFHLHHHHHVEDPFPQFFEGATTDEAAPAALAPPGGVDGGRGEAKSANGVLEVRVPAPRAATPRIIEVTAA